MSDIDYDYDLTADSKLDKHHLDDAAEQQSYKLERWLALLDTATSKVAREKKKVERVEARLFLEAKTNELELFGKTKVTDALIKAWIVLQPAHIKVVDRLLDAEEKLSHINRAKTVLEHKKAMIQTAANLWVCGYYARPKVGRKGSDVGANREAQKDSLMKSLGKAQYKEKREE